MSGMDFYLAQLDFGITAASATLSGASTTSFNGDATVEVDVPLSAIQNTFNFQTDSTDFNDLANVDISYRVSYTPADPVLPFDIEPDVDTNVIVNAIDAGAATNSITRDYIRYLALKLFNTHLGVDLFDNETTLRGDFNTSFKSGLDTVLVNLAADGVSYATGTSPSKSILSQIINSEPSRLNDITDYEIAGQTVWYKMPVAVGDKLYFVVTVSAAANQHDLTGVPLIADRTYLMKLNVVADVV
jgi:hypothetical protein